MRATICIPTFNERENLEAMVDALAAVLRDGDRILVIDDNSPDGTGEIADRLAKREFVDVLHREKKEGLGPAYIAGFQHALADGAELVVQIDCDFSHNPSDVPRLIAEAEAGSDLVIGSRYVRNGRVSGWALIRRVISRGGSLYTALFLRMGVKDPTGGFKCYRRSTLMAIDIDSVRTRGYAFQIETTWRVKQLDLTVSEIPITFIDRSHGKSKMSRNVVFEALWHVPLMRLRPWLRHRRS